MRRLLQKIPAHNPRVIFVIDAAGALLSTVLLLVLALLPGNHTGIQQHILLSLVSLTACYAVYSAYCYVYAARNGKKLLGVLIFLNLLYCLLTSVIVYNHRDVVSILGWVYFSGEILIILLLARLEFMVFHVWNTDDTET